MKWVFALVIGSVLLLALNRAKPKNRGRVPILPYNPDWEPIRSWAEPDDFDLFI